MGRPDDRGHRSAEQTPAAVDYNLVPHRARLYLEAAAHQSAHEILEPALLSPSPPGLPQRFELLALLLECCHALGHAEHLERYTEELQALWNAGSGLSADARIRARATLAKIRSQQGAYDAAIRLCAQVSDEDLDLCGHGAAVSLYASLMNARMRKGDLDGAEDAVARILERADRSGDPALEGSARNLMANVLKTRGRFLEAQRLYNQAAGLHRRGGDFAGVTRDHLNRAGLLNRMGLVNESEEAYQEAFRQAAAIGHRLLSLRASLGLGMVKTRMGGCQQARGRLLACWRESRRLAHRREEALALEFLGEACILLRRIPQARRALSLCRRLAASLAPEGDLVVECGLRQAFLALTEGNPSEAEAHSHSAITLAAGRGMAWEEAQGWRLLGAACIRLGRREAARDAWQKSLELFAGMEEGLEITLVRRSLDHLQDHIRGPVDFSPGVGTLPASNLGLDHGPALHPSALFSKIELISRRAPGEVADRIKAESVLATESVTETMTESMAEGGIPMGTTPETVGADEKETMTVAETVPSYTRHRAAPVSAPIWRQLGLVTRSARLLQLMEDARARALAGDVILILGETGTGKDLLAQAIHTLSGRRGAFIPFNCAACPVELVESELFGIERGAFTGADRRRHGLALDAAGGTLFLDEIGDLPARAQGAVLRFVDQGEVRALGSSAIRKVTLGLVAATHHPLHERVDAGAFRQDLYYRLTQGILEVPPLRERAEDLDLLVEHLWARLTDGGAPPGWLLQEATLQTLRRHRWPGNVRELEQFLRAIRMHPDQKLRPEQIRSLLQGPRGSPGSDTPTPAEIEQAIRIATGNRRQAAAMLGISRAKLYRLLESGRGRGGRL